MFYNAEHNQYVTEGTAFTLGDIAYPANWLNNATADEKAAAGLVEVTVVGAPGDDRYYWVSETLDGPVLTYVNTPKDLDALKTQQIDTVNRSAYSLLFASDWMVVREAEGGTPMADDWKAYRASVRSTANAARAAIESASDVDALISVCHVEWPRDPNYQTPDGA